MPFKFPLDDSELNAIYTCPIKDQLIRFGNFDSNRKHTYENKDIFHGYFWSVFSCIRTEYTKIRTKNNSVFGHFSYKYKMWFGFYTNLNIDSSSY